MSLPWTEKYRPKKLDDIRGHQKIREIFKIAAAAKCNGFPPCILYGPPGTGKTSLALALATETYPDISPTITSLYLNASDERSIEVIRDRILDFARTSWPGVQRKFIIFDEIETMTEPAQASLRYLLDDTENKNDCYQPLYIFLCNSLYRIHTSIRSRCIPFFCGHLPARIIREFVKEIHEKENKVGELPTDTTLTLLRGDMRSMLLYSQSGVDINEWDKWIRDLFAAGSDSLAVWQRGIMKTPIHILCRHILVWLENNGLLTSKYEPFILASLKIRDISNEDAVSEIARVWGHSLGARPP
jgi:replication factor C small subunit